MPTAVESKTREFAWQYPAREGDPFVLREDGTDVGWLEFHETPARSTACVRGRNLIFHYRAFGHNLHPRVTITSEEDPEHVVAEFMPCWTDGGWVSFDNGVCYRWRKSHLWGKTWCFRQQGQESSVCLSQDSGPLMEGGKVHVCCDAADRPETPVLLLLAWFLRILDFEMLVDGLFRVG